MPRYFFSCDGAQVFTDQDGTELPDLHAARVQAVQNAGEILKDHAESFSDYPRWRMAVSDETGRVLFRLNFSIEQEPAASA